MINGELIIDNFAGGGGASTGIELATGHSVDIAINHDPEAIRMHATNHPNTKHYCEDVWQVNPVEVCGGKPVALVWFSPDCKHFSKAKGGKPKDKRIRGLAWVALRWAGLVRPRVIMLENVEEFQTWGPLNRSHRPIKAKRGVTFKRFIKQLKNLGYEVEYRELTAADYGAPTKRKRFFLIARCDGLPIIWPHATHAPADSEKVKSGQLKPYAGAYTQIDFTLPCPSIFDTSEEIKEKYGIKAVRPLAPKTLERIARGLKKFVLDNAEPFAVCINHNGSSTDYRSSITEPALAPYIMCNNENNVGADVYSPLPTITTGNRNFTVVPTLIQYHSETTGKEVRGQQVTEPVMTVDSSNRYGLVTAFLQQYYSGGYKMPGKSLDEPLPTITAVDHNSLCAATLIQLNNHCSGADIKEPLPTITANGEHFAEVQAFLIKYYGSSTGQDISSPLDTITAKDRFGLVTIKGIDYQIADIGLRMLEPRELYGCQGFWHITLIRA